MNRVKGFTLMELLIVVAIIGILASIAIPSYRSYVLKANRAGAVTAILDLASRQARHYTTNNTYVTSLTTLGYASDPLPVDTSYNVSVLTGTTAGFTLQAVPIGAQASDVCGTFKYDDLGKRENTGTGSISECWKQ